MVPGDIFDSLMAQIHQRASSMPEGSYTTKLIRAGTAKMGSKVLEEVLETVLAAYDCESRKSFAVEPTGADESQVIKTQAVQDHLVYEACDVIYHLWVLLGSQGITVDQLRRELERREGVSGLDEKQSRNSESKRS